MELEITEFKYKGITFKCSVREIYCSQTTVKQWDDDDQEVYERTIPLKRIRVYVWTEGYGYGLLKPTGEYWDTEIPLCLEWLADRYISAVRQVQQANKQFEANKI